MEYNYGDITYNKRPLTNDIALGIVSNDLTIAENKTAQFKKLTDPYKIGEQASRQNACPVTGFAALRDRIDFLKETFEGFRIRNAQLSGVISVKGTLKNIDGSTAAYLISCGSIAVLAEGYEEDSDKILLANGILPLISSGELPIGTFILIRNIKKDIHKGKLDSYIVVPGKLSSVNISLSEYTDKELEAIIN